jgi:hypothetical protein
MDKEIIKFFVPTISWECIVDIVIFSAMIFFAYKYFHSAPSEKGITIEQEIDNK